MQLFKQGNINEIDMLSQPKENLKVLLSFVHQSKSYFETDIAP